MSKDKIKVTGYVKLLVRRPDGSVKLKREGKNILVDVGLQEMAELMAGVATNIPSHVAIGDSGADPSVGETALAGTEKDRQTVTISQLGPQTTIICNTLGAGLGSSTTIKEAGIFNAAAAGDMYARFLTGDVPLDPDERIEIEWTLTFS